MRMPLGIVIGARYIFGYRAQLLARFFAPIFAIALSVATIILVFNVSNGMIAGIVTKFIETGIYHVRADSEQLYSAEELRAAQQQLLDDPFIEHVGFEYNSVGLLSINGMRQGVSVRAISREIWHDDPAFREHIIIEHGTLRLSEPEDIMIGSHLAQQLNIEIDDTVELISLNRADDLVFPRISTHRVQGIFSAGYRALDRLWVLLPFEYAEQSLAKSSLQTIVGVKTTNPFAFPNPLIRGGNTTEARAAIRSMRKALPDSFTVSSWFQFRASQFLSFRSTKNILLFIMLLIIAVAMIHLVSALNTLVLEKRTEIAYLKSIGASAGHIRLIFISCGFYIGSGGALLGTLLGLLASIHINWILRAVEAIIAAVQQVLSIPHGINLSLLRQEFYLEQIPITLSLRGLLLIFFITLLLSIIAAFIPAKKSAAINPIQMLSDTQR